MACVKELSADNGSKKLMEPTGTAKGVVAKAYKDLKLAGDLGIYRVLGSPEPCCCHLCGCLGLGCSGFSPQKRERVKGQTAKFN